MLNEYQLGLTTSTQRLLTYTNENKYTAIVNVSN